MNNTFDTTFENEGKPPKPPNAVQAGPQNWNAAYTSNSHQPPIETKEMHTSPRFADSPHQHPQQQPFYGYSSNSQQFPPSINYQQNVITSSETSSPISSITNPTDHDFDPSTTVIEIMTKFPNVPKSAFSLDLPPPPDTNPRVTTTLWEAEGTLCFQVEARQVCVARREDNNMINGTKLLNVAGMTRGRRDGILKTEKYRKVVKVGAMHFKGVWIPYERAIALADKENIIDLLYPLFVVDIRSLLCHPQNYQKTAAVRAAAERKREENKKNLLRQTEHLQNHSRNSESPQQSYPLQPQHTQQQFSSNIQQHNTNQQQIIMQNPGPSQLFGSYVYHNDPGQTQYVLSNPSGSNNIKQGMTSTQTQPTSNYNPHLPSQYVQQSMSPHNQSGSNQSGNYPYVYPVYPQRRHQHEQPQQQQPLQHHTHFQSSQSNLSNPSSPSQQHQSHN